MAVQSHAATTVNLKRGDRLGKYRLQKCLGKGGYSEVWKARDCVEGIWVALKVPNIGVDGQRDNKSLMREVHMLVQLRHRHLMPVKNADIIDGHAILATELSAGTLDDCSRPMSFRRITSIATQVLDGLSYAHQHRIVHCDVTPSNIFLFPNGRAALGDFSIGQQIKGRLATIDEYGTPGYVAPEQAYGHPTYRSDCFAVGLILYEFLTAVLPRWPFNWPFRGHNRLCERTSPGFVRFLRQALRVEPEKRFSSAENMLTAMRHVLPKNIKSGRDSAAVKKADWQQIRREEFIKRYRKALPALLKCVRCSEPVSENMVICPWCGTGRNRFDSRTRFSHVCYRCHRGVWPEWRFCPWCYGPGFKSPSPVRTVGVHYDGKCRYCGGKVMRFMKYCPWCRHKIHKAWRVKPFPEVCGRCGWSVDSSFWNYCPWCEYSLLG
ncbi:MAG: serine/threonine-protein kinase [Planctomycetota bacterium]